MNNENKNITTIKIVSILLVLILVFIAFFNIDKYHISNGFSSIFTVPIIFYKDGGSIYRIGIGYGVFEWNKLGKYYENEQELIGEYIGNEIINFPKCYLIIGNKKIEPSIKLIIKKWS